MRKLLFLLILLLPGCAAIDVEFAKQVRDYNSIILPEYRAYVENDSMLDDDSKRIRAQTADKFEDLIDAALK